MCCIKDGWRSSRYSFVNSLCTHSIKGNAFLDELEASEQTSNELKEFITQVKTTFSPTSNLEDLQQNIQPGNVEMRLHMIKGMFSVSGDLSLMAVALILGAKWNTETLSEGEDLEAFALGFAARNWLATMSLDHENVFRMCAEDYTNPAYGPDIRRFLKSVLDDVQKIQQ